MDPQVIPFGAPLVKHDAPGEPRWIFVTEQIVADQPERSDVSRVAEPGQHVGDLLLRGCVDCPVSGQVEPVESIKIGEMEQRHQLGA